MAQTLTHKIISTHLISGKMEKGEEIAVKIDRTLTQDATGTMAYLQFQAMGVDKVKTEFSISYVDHNMLQMDFRNADDHKYLQSVAAKHGIYFSRPGNGICHQVNVERFAVPGETLLGSDSHTPTSGGLGMMAIGAGGLDVAVAMAGGPFYMKMPEVVGVKLIGKLRPWVAAKDIILELLRRLSVKGGVGRVFEYFGPGVKTLSVPERATITNMGAELGATTSIFPSDEMTLDFLRRQGREQDWVNLEADWDAEYDMVEVIDLNQLVPMVAKPHQPHNVVPVSEIEGTPLTQVNVGSCTNSSYHDLMVVSNALRGRKVSEKLSMTVSPGSSQVFRMIAGNNALADMIAAGVRVLESACGPCIGMGQAPTSAGNTLRSFNRNFKGRSGTPDANIFLASPETCVASALNGCITDPRKLGDYPEIKMPQKFLVDDRLVIPPAEDPQSVEVIMGPNIHPVEDSWYPPLDDKMEIPALLKVEDNITTDHIMPAGAKVLPLRSNIPAIAEYVYYLVDGTYAKRAKEAGASIIIGGENYGQGSSREHAAIAPRYLGVRVVIAKSFARIHKDNLCNHGILPATFVNPEDYDKCDQGDVFVFKGLRKSVEKQADFVAHNKTKGIDIKLHVDASKRQAEDILAGGLIMKMKNANK